MLRIFCETLALAQHKPGYTLFAELLSKLRAPSSPHKPQDYVLHHPQAANASAEIACFYQRQNSQRL